MDHTPMDELLSELEQADPADAPDIADEIAATLSQDLDSDTPEGGTPEAPA